MSEEMSVLPIPEGLQVSGRLKEGLSPTNQFAVDSFITAHAALFGVQEKPHPGVNRYQYGTTPMEVGDPLNKRGLTLYLEKRKRMFFVLSRATKNDKGEFFEKLEAERARSEAALRALRVRPGGDQNSEMNVLSDLFPLVPGLSSIKLDSQLAFISLTRAEEVLQYVKGLDSEFAGQHDPEIQKTYNLFNVVRREKQPA